MSRAARARTMPVNLSLGTWSGHITLEQRCALPPSHPPFHHSKMARRSPSSDYLHSDTRVTLGPFSGLGACGSVLPSRYPQAQLSRKENPMKELLQNVWMNDQGEDIAEYAVMLAVILVIVVGTIRLIGSQANNVFSETASAMGG